MAIDWRPAPDVKKRLLSLIKRVGVSWIKSSQVICFRSTDAATRAYARIWGLSRIWQQALKLKPSYILEVISEKYDGLNKSEQDKILLHELNHIPRNFSGALVPHTRHRKGSFRDRLKKLYEGYNFTRR